MTDVNETPDPTTDDTEGHRWAKGDADDTRDDADDTEGHRWA
jgi:hypothetical protein